MMNVKKTDLVGVLLIEPDRFGYHRGFFAEAYNQRLYVGLGIHANFVQDNHSLSASVGTLRGLHFQVSPHAQAKLVRCGRGQFLMWLLIYEGEVQLMGNGQAASSAPQMAYRCSFRQALRTGS